MARINSDDIETLRDRADIVEVVSGYTALKRSGGHSFKGLCPFHSEKTPSFTVDNARNLFYCFGCGEGGNVYQFIERVESLPFPEAVEWLARREGFDLRFEEMKPGDREAFGVKRRLVDANNEAAGFFHRTLMEDTRAAEARRYLGSRGFDREVAARWQLGYAPGKDSLCRHLLAKAFTNDEITQADLGRISEHNRNLYDTFRERITFPTWNLQGDVVGFGARLVSGEGPKYLNTSETLVFQKSRVMYGLNKAKSAIARGAAIVVEGYTDVIALHEAGAEEAVATNGVALAESHFELLKRFSSRAVLMFDADEAGKGATERGFGLHHRIGLEVLVAPLPSGKDPADVVKEGGVEGINAVVASAQPLLRFKLEQTVGRMRLDTPEARSSAVREAVKVLGLHPDPVARHEYAFMAAGLIGVDAEVIQRALGEQRPGVPEEVRGSGGDLDRRFPGHVKVEREALMLLLTQPAKVGQWSERLVEDDFTSSPRREVFLAARDRAASQGIASLAERLSPEAHSLLIELTVGAADEDVWDDASSVGVDEIFARLRLFRLERVIRSISTTLQDVNPVEEPARHDELFTELVGLQAERRDLHKEIEVGVQ